MTIPGREAVAAQAAVDELQLVDSQLVKLQLHSEIAVVGIAVGGVAVGEVAPLLLGATGSCVCLRTYIQPAG